MPGSMARSFIRACNARQGQSLGLALGLRARGPFRIGPPRGPLGVDRIATSCQIIAGALGLFARKAQRLAGRRHRVAVRDAQAHVAPATRW